MRWKEKKSPVVGDKRTIRRFLLWKRKIGDELRRWEWAIIEQELRWVATGYAKSKGLRWVDVAWVNSWQSRYGSPPLAPVCSLPTMPEPRCISTNECGEPDLEPDDC